MKKRYIVLAGFLALGVIGNLTESPEAKEARQLEHQQTRQLMAEKEAERKAKYESQFVISSAQRTQCRQAIQQAMHDPSSFRWEGSMSNMRRTGVLKFSGTNAFGGRVQQTYACS